MFFFSLIVEILSEFFIFEKTHLFLENLCFTQSLEFGLYKIRPNPTSRYFSKVKRFSWEFHDWLWLNIRLRGFTLRKFNQKLFFWRKKKLTSEKTFSDFLSFKSFSSLSVSRVDKIWMEIQQIKVVWNSAEISDLYLDKEPKIIYLTRFFFTI